MCSGWLRLGVVALSLGFGLGSCTEVAPDDCTEPGEVVGCECESGSSGGERVCLADGTRSECVCRPEGGGDGDRSGDGDGDGSGPGDGDTPGDGDAPGDGDGDRSGDGDGDAPPVGGGDSSGDGSGPAPTGPPTGGGPLSVCDRDSDCDSDRCYGEDQDGGFCAQECSSDSDCDAIDGFVAECGSTDACRVDCDGPDDPCPTFMVCTRNIVRSYRCVYGSN